MKFDLDRQNQYSRRESIRISDISETGENTNALVTKLAADIGVSVTETDISVSHRLPGRPGSARPVIVKCVRRDTKTSMMKNKRRLCDLDRKGVFLNDDLTVSHETGENIKERLDDWESVDHRWSHHLHDNCER